MDNGRPRLLLKKGYSTSNTRFILTLMNVLRQKKTRTSFWTYHIQCFHSVDKYLLQNLTRSFTKYEFSKTMILERYSKSHIVVM